MSHALEELQDKLQDCDGGDLSSHEFNVDLLEMFLVPAGEPRHRDTSAI